MSETAVSLFYERVARHPDRVALRVLSGHGSDSPAVTWGDWGAQARQFAAALTASGGQPGDTVAIWAGNRPLWPIGDLGTLSAGMLSVGLYPTSAPAQVRQILADSVATVAVVDTKERLAGLLQVRHELPALRTIICQDAGAPGVVLWDEWLRRGADALANGAAAEVERRITRGTPDDIALLIYTSGSTGEPKGARISHRYLLSSAASIGATLGLTATDSSLSFLPFCHAAERVFGLYTRIHAGMEAVLVEDHTRVPEAAQRFAPTIFGGLPRFYEKAYEALRAEQEAATGAERARWERVLELGRERSRLRETGGVFPAEREAEWRELGAPLFERVRSFFGGRVRMATSGGALLPVEVTEYLDALGLTVLGAYGLTEHLCVAFNQPARYAFHSVGPVMPGSEIRIAEDGEILVRRGPLTFSGYHGRMELTWEAFTPDGEWLCTGDLGALDDSGFLHVTGRKKELIALSTGKKVAPAPIEARLLEHPWISQAMLYGESRKFVAALITLRPSLVEAWARGAGLAVDAAALASHPQVVARVQEAVDRVNEQLSRTEQIRRFVILERELSLEEDELTPTLKIRRPVVAERFRERLDALYR
ncbi:MAG: AMP-dependent synthetase/ligase [Longimicrobiaceae bacterium]